MLFIAFIRNILYHSLSLKTIFRQNAKAIFLRGRIIDKIAMIKINNKIKAPSLKFLKKWSLYKFYLLTKDTIFSQLNQ